MTCLITGGAGFLGVNLVRWLLKHTNDLIITVDKLEMKWENDRHSHFTFDLPVESTIYEFLIKSANVIIHAAAALPLASLNEIHKTNIESTEQITKLAVEYRKPLIYISSTAVYKQGSEPKTETSHVSGTGAYGHTKAEAERICIKCADKIPVTILRPKTFIGPERLGIFALLYDFAAAGHHFPIIGEGNNRLQLLHVEDLCHAIYFVVENKLTGVYNVGADEFTTLKNDFQALLSYAGYGKRIWCLPKVIIKVLKFLGNRKLVPTYEWLYEGLINDSIVSVEKLKRAGFVPRYSNQDALFDNYNWFVENRKKLHKGTDHRSVWNFGLLKLAKLLF